MSMKPGVPFDWLRPAHRRLPQLFLLIVGGLALFGLIRYFAIYADFPFDVHPDEGWWVYKAWMLRNGENIYPDLTDYPFFVTNYPPFFHVVTAFLMLFTGTSMLAGRLVSILAAFALGAAMFASLYRESGRLLPSVVVGVLLIASPFFAEYGRVAKGDVLALALGLWGVYLYTEFQKRSASGGLSWVLPVAAAFLLVASFFTKQPAISLLIACVASAVVQSRISRRSSMIFLLASVVLLLGFFLLLQTLTRGRFYVQVLSSGSQQGAIWDADAVVGRTRYFWST